MVLSNTYWSSTLESKEKDLINTSLGIFLSVFSLFYGNSLGNQNYIKEKKVEEIKNYLKDFNQCERMINKIDRHIKKELIYTCKNISNWMDYLIQKIEKSELEIFFIEIWKVSKKFYISLNKIIGTFKDNYFSFKTIIEELKSLGLSEQQINNKIKVLITFFDYSNQINSEIIADLSNNNKEIGWLLQVLAECLNPLINNQIEYLKNSIENLRKEIERVKEVFNECLKECSTHKHLTDKKLFLCWSSIRKIKNVIYSN